jgi:hypothetical protein
LCIIATFGNKRARLVFEGMTRLQTRFMSSQHGAPVTDVEMTGTALRRTQPGEETHMRKTVLATLIAVAFGLVGLSAAQAAPANGLAIGKAASGLADFDKAQWRRRRRRRRRRRCWHRGRSRTRCRW